jgi:hypothetical protein
MKLMDLSKVTNKLITYTMSRETGVCGELCGASDVSIFLVVSSVVI